MILCGKFRTDRPSFFAVCVVPRDSSVHFRRRRRELGCGQLLPCRCWQRSLSRGHEGAPVPFEPLASGRKRSRLVSRKPRVSREKQKEKMSERHDVQDVQETFREAIWDKTVLARARWAWRTFPRACARRPFRSLHVNERHSSVQRAEKAKADAARKVVSFLRFTCTPVQNRTRMGCLRASPAS